MHIQFWNWNHDIHMTYIDKGKCYNNAQNVVALMKFK